jgi:hypothetical protein
MTLHVIRSKHISSVRSFPGKSSLLAQKGPLPGMAVTSEHAGVDRVAFLGNSAVVQHGGRANAWILRVLCTVAGSAGCLPVGTPPVGQHVIADRTLTGVYLSPSEQEGVPSHLLATGPLRGLPLASVYASSEPYVSDGAALSDLYVIPYDGVASPASGLAGWQPVVSDLVVDYRALIGGDIPTDSQGRLIFLRYVPDLDLMQIERVDLADRATSQVGYPSVLVNGQFFVLSPARTRVYSPGQLCELDGCLPVNRAASEAGAGATANQFATIVAFIGEDFYYVDRPAGASAATGGNLNRIRPQATPEVLLSFTGTVTFQPILSDRTPQLLLFLSTDSGAAPFALLDTDTLNTTSLPPEKGQAQFVSASSDGHWLAFVTALAAANPGQRADHRLFLYDWTTGSHATVDSARVGQGIGTYREWRPGRAELWFSTFDDGLGVWRPDAGLATARSTLLPYLRAPEDKSSVFTRDGRHWFSMGEGGEGARSTVYVGSSDAPTAPLQVLNPRGTVTTSYWETDGGRLLVGAWTLDGNRKDIYLVDADAGTSRAIASTGHLLALGHTRALALLNWESARESGDLTLIDLASGAHTVLAENVYEVSVDRGMSASVPPGGDTLAPGTRVAFLTNNRLASPWDGLWVASLP